MAKSHAHVLSRASILTCILKKIQGTNR
ncbi:hypothetical protein F383_22367 [Gossypium arboreum]|uniref:Uncharacterized protein n=1 Tax=Gossypium arboreum TaxID=29729 RepID=A0A0B0MQG1_GOSAR|nr:hypothetical protein F383_22367 [Gossypium arboreum]